MKNLFRKLFCLAVTGSILSVMPASAQSHMTGRERTIYDYGFSYGTLGTLCILFTNGEIAENIFIAYVKIAKSNTKGKIYKDIREKFSKDSSDFMRNCAPYFK